MPSVGRNKGALATTTAAAAALPFVLGSPLGLPKALSGSWPSSHLPAAKMLACGMTTGGRVEEKGIAVAEPLAGLAAVRFGPPAP